MIIYVTENNGVYSPVVDASERGIYIPRWETKNVYQAEKEGAKYRMAGAIMCHITFERLQILKEQLNSFIEKVKDAQDNLDTLNPGADGRAIEEFMIDNADALQYGGGGYCVLDGNNSLNPISEETAKVLIAQKEKEDEGKTEASYEFDGYKVDVQINSDNDFDYTIYKNGEHLDGGVIENIDEYEDIPDYVIEEIKKMHDIGTEKNSKYDQVFGYIYDERGRHGDKFEFEGSPKNMAHFIMYNWAHPVVITDMVDQFIVSSVMGGFLDRVSSPELREELIKEIYPLQMGDKTPINVAGQEDD